MLKNFDPNAIVDSRFFYDGDKRLMTISEYDDYLETKNG